MSANTLTERYVHEVVRRVPADQRAEIGDELRATIADALEGRGADERAVLAEMGDPIRLAARYADRPLSLVGPELYPAYVRLLTVLLSTVLPLVTVLSVALAVLDGAGAGAAIGSGVGALITVGAQMIAWPTVVFALVERSRYRDRVVRDAGSWTPDDLPPLRNRDERALGAAASVAWNVLLLGLIVWQHVATPLEHAGREAEVLDAGLWSGWIWPILAGLVALSAVELVRIAVRGWTVRLAVWTAAAEALFALPLAWVLYREAFFDPAFLAEVKVLDGFYTVAALGVLAVSANRVFQRFRAARG
ncbi:permease prefix domain 1-containing protein [Actinomadura kijaniata]|uniref:Uncharacterized protein n=1 Tax=Actinomadura namibiensis TaxID=182080 RepID=A0A7W3LN68_ACTNM|nr:hypothetical protein [Actinomadura namibiensis]MBA8951120.1 hypothetical protein [Actinomadura namibiensis]